MQWPLSHDIQRVDSTDVVLVLRDGAALAPDDLSAEALDDLLRSAITFGVSAIDRYVHERIVKAFVNAFQILYAHQASARVPSTSHARH